jgi:hypothetical protein
MSFGAIDFPKVGGWSPGMKSPKAGSLAAGQNPKAKIRRPKEIRNSKPELGQAVFPFLRWFQGNIVPSARSHFRISGVKS